MARVAAGTPPPGLPRCACRVVARPAPRSDAQPRPPIRPGAGSRRRDAEPHRPPARALPAHAGLRGTLRSAAARADMELLGAREGHLDHARVGEARKARRLGVDHDVHRGERTPSAQPRGERVADRAQLSRDRHAAVSARPRVHVPRATAATPNRRSRCLPWAAPSTRRDSTIFSPLSHGFRAIATGS